MPQPKTPEEIAAIVAEHQGTQIGRLTLLHFFRDGRYWRWLCECECGKQVSPYFGSLKTGNTRSCGCLRNEVLASLDNKYRTHGRYKTPEYRSWSSMKSRCSDPKVTGYARYGGRGITVCERWMKFENFLADMGERPSIEYSLDRIDYNGNYCPENCRWATWTQQNRNKSDVKFYEFAGRCMTLPEWCELLGVPYPIVRTRIQRHGWSFVRAVTTGHTRKSRRKNDPRRRNELQTAAS